MGNETTGFREWLSLDEMSRWRRDDVLPQVAGIKGTPAGVSRIKALAAASKRLGRDADNTVPGFKGWADNLDYVDADARAMDHLKRGEHPPEVYRGSSSQDAAQHGGRYATHGGSIFVSPFAGVAQDYVRDPRRPQTTHGARLSTGDKTYSVVGRFGTTPDDGYTRDYGMERGEPTLTPAERLQDGEYEQSAKHGTDFAVRKWNYEGQGRASQYRGLGLAKRVGHTPAAVDSHVAPLDARGEKIVRSAGKMIGKTAPPPDNEDDYDNPYAGGKYD